MPLELDSQINAVCDAVCDLLNAGDAFSFEFEAKRFADAGEALENLPGVGLRVAVLPQAKRRQRISRGQKQLEFDVSVAVLKKIDITNGDELDGLMRLTDELADYLEEKPLACEARQMGDIEILWPYAPNHRRDLHVFLCPATVTYVTFT